MIKCYYKGDDVKINLKIKDSAGAYLDLTTYKYIHARIKIAGSTFLYKASTDETLVAEGYSLIVPMDVNTMQIVIDSSVTITMPVGYATMGINLVKDDAVLADNNLNTNIEITRIFKLQDTDTKIGEES